LKSTQKSPLTLPSNSGLRTNWDKFGSAQETEIDGIEAAFGRPASQFLRKLGSADATTRTWAEFFHSIKASSPRPIAMAARTGLESVRF